MLLIFFVSLAQARIIDDDLLINGDLTIRDSNSIYLGGNGNIIGPDIDISAGTGDYLSTGTLGSGALTITPGNDVTGLTINSRHNQANPNILFDNNTDKAWLFITDFAGGSQLRLGTDAGQISFKPNNGTGTVEMTDAGAGTLDLLWKTDSGGDIGASGATRPRDIFVANDITAGGQFLAANGTKTAPSHSFTNGVQTGMYYDQAIPELKFSVNNVDHLSFNNSTGTKIMRAGLTLTAGLIATIDTMVLGTGSITDTTGAISFGNDNLSGIGTIVSGDITIFDATPILVFKDSDSLGAASVGFIEWRDSGGGRAGFFGNSSSGNDDLLWKNEQGGNIGIQTTGAGNLDIIAALAQFNATPITTTGTLDSGVLTVKSDLVFDTGSITSVSGAISLGDDSLRVDGHIGIGTAPHTDRAINIEGTFETGANGITVNINRTYDPTAANLTFSGSSIKVNLANSSENIAILRGTSTTLNVPGNALYRGTVAEGTTANISMSFAGNVSGGDPTMTVGQLVNINAAITGLGSSIGTLYAIDLKEQTAGSTNWQIFSRGGNSAFGGNTSFGKITAPTATLDVAGSIKSSEGRIVGTTRVTSTPYTILSTDHNIFIDTDAADITANLPVGVDGTYHRITNAGTTGNNVIVVPNGAELLDGANASKSFGRGVITLTYETTEGWQ